jgi:3-oxoacyl-[acyl-carrier protein] reductase
VDKPRGFDPADLKMGLQAAFERRIGAEDIAAFAALSGDHNPIHVDAEYARTTSYERVIAHGAFQVALASTMAGMYLPGRNVVIGLYHSRFPAPLFVPAVVRVQGEILNWVPSANTGVLRVTVVELERSTLTADIRANFFLYGPKVQVATFEHRAARTDRPDRPLVIITGAGAGLGFEMVSALEDSYRILALSRSEIPESVSGLPGVEALACDLEVSGWEAALDAAINLEPVYGIVHCAWPGAPKGGLLEVDAADVMRQVEFGSLVTIQLARWLAQRSQGEARLIAIGATFGSIKPPIGLSAYSLGKATLEHTVKLLAPELARKRITINAVLPSFMHLGMNRTATNRNVLGETAKVPLGRLCTPNDVAAMLRYLLSREAAFATGQLFPLTGGQL